MPEDEDQIVQVVFEPIGRRVGVTAGATVLEAARAAGVAMVGVCGGRGACDTCRIRLLDGVLSSPSPAEKTALIAEDLRSGIRLACQAALRSDARIWILPEALAAEQRLQLEGEAYVLAAGGGGGGVGVGVDDMADASGLVKVAGVADVDAFRNSRAHVADPVIIGVDVHVDVPSLQDLRSDAGRLIDAVNEHGLSRPTISLAVLRGGVDRLREQNWSARAVIGRYSDAPEIVALLPRGSRMVGLAVDIGSTKIAAYLADLQTAERLAVAGAVNPQVVFGEDIITRIASANQSESDRQKMTTHLVAAVNELTERLCADASITPDCVVEAVVVGNTVMHHFFAGLPVRQLGESPFVAAAEDAMAVPANEIGLHLAAGARIYLPPNVAGYVGADHVAMLSAVGLWHTKQTVVALDIGTNTEISVARDGRVWSCSCASGPAFEGAHLRNGMRASPGAVERVRLIDGRFHWHTVGGADPVGFCGSGILDAVAEMRAADLLDARGRLAETAAAVCSEDGTPYCRVVPATETGHGRDLVVTRADVHEIQLAKGAIRTGIDILLSKAGITAADVDAFLIAGAFGTYLDLKSAVRIGMFPDIPGHRFRQLGNAAGMGALQMLLSAKCRRTAEEAVRRIEYVELTTHEHFHDRFMEALFL